MCSSRQSGRGPWELWQREWMLTWWRDHSSHEFVTKMNMSTLVGKMSCVCV